MENQAVFEKTEYLARIRKVHHRMADLDIDTLLVVDPANMNYLSGYDGWSFYAHQGLLVRLDEDVPYWFGREQDRSGALLTTWLPEDHLFTYPEYYVQSFSDHTMRFVASVLASNRWDKGRLGVELDGYWYSARSHIELQQRLPGTTLVDADRLVNWARTYKSEKELELMREAASICTHVMETAFSVIKDGVHERSAAAAVAAAQIEGIDGIGGDFPAIFPIMPAGPRTVAGHLTYDPQRAYRNGDIVMLELSGCRKRYHMPLYRTMCIGKPSANLISMAAIMDDAFTALLDCIMPGSVAEMIERQWRAIMAPHHVLAPARVGYAFGLNYVPDWGEHTVNLRPGEKTVLAEHMTIHLIASLRIGSDVFETSEPVLVTGNGCTRFMDVPRALHCS